MRISVSADPGAAVSHPMATGVFGCFIFFGFVCFRCFSLSVFNFCFHYVKGSEKLRLGQKLENSLKKVKKAGV